VLIREIRVEKVSIPSHHQLAAEPLMFWIRQAGFCCRTKTALQFLRFHSTLFA
jgi:hypothetical protein